MEESTICSEEWVASLDRSDNFYRLYNRKYSRLALLEMKRVTGDACPTPHGVIEYYLYLALVKGATPARIIKTFEFLYKASPVMDGIPKIKCAYLRSPYLLPLDKVLKYINSIRHPSSQAFLAMVATGFKRMHFIGRNITVGEYDEESGIVAGWKALADWQKPFLDEHKRRAIELGLKDSDALFYHLRRDGKYEATSIKKYKKEVQRVDLHMGVKFLKHCWISYGYKTVPSGGIILYI